MTSRWDKAGNLRYQTDGNGNITQSIYDELNRLTQVKNALDEITEYTYDAAGNMLTQTDAAGNVTPLCGTTPGTCL